MTHLVPNLLVHRISWIGAWLMRYRLHYNSPALSLFRHTKTEWEILMPGFRVEKQSMCIIRRSWNGRSYLNNTLILAVVVLLLFALHTSPLPHCVVCTHTTIAFNLCVRYLLTNSRVIFHPINCWQLARRSHALLQSNFTVIVYRRCCRRRRTLQLAVVLFNEGILCI